MKLNKKNIIRLVIVILGLANFGFGVRVIKAATFYWTQASWAGNWSLTNATHTSNQNNWTKFATTTGTTINGSNHVELTRETNGVN